jgi:acid stress-induced BolA-like protein IbaG/YrbA
MNPSDVQALIETGLPEAKVVVRSEDNVHFEALVVSGGFTGLRPLQRHQKVYQTLGELMGGEIHALALETLTPDELAARGR